MPRDQRVVYRDREVEFGARGVVLAAARRCGWGGAMAQLGVSGEVEVLRGMLVHAA